MIPDPAPPYEFGCSGALSDRVRRVLERARAMGIGPSIERALAFIVDRFIDDPRGWGDLIRNLGNAELVEYHGRHANFLAVYSVHDRVPIVFLLRLILLPGNPLVGENLET